MVDEFHLQHLLRVAFKVAPTVQNLARIEVCFGPCLSPGYPNSFPCADILKMTISGKIPKKTCWQSYSWSRSGFPRELLAKWGTKTTKWWESHSILMVQLHLLNTNDGYRHSIHGENHLVHQIRDLPYWLEALRAKKSFPSCTPLVQQILNYAPNINQSRHLSRRVQLLANMKIRLCHLPA